MRLKFPTRMNRIGRLARSCWSAAARRRDLARGAARWVCAVAAVGTLASTAGCAASRVSVAEANVSKEIPLNDKPIALTRLEEMLAREDGVLFHRARGIHNPLVRPYFFLLKKRGAETIIQELDGEGGPEYQAFIGGYLDPVRRTEAAPLEYVAMGFPRYARNRQGDTSRLKNQQPLVFVMQGGDEVVYVSTKAEVRSTGGYGTAGGGTQVIIYPDFYRYRLEGLRKDLSGPVEVVLDFETGWVWLVPIKDGGVDASRVAIAVWHGMYDFSRPNVMAYQIASE